MATHALRQSFALALVVDAPPTEVAGDQILFDEPA
jgi:hypothetical protein